MKKNGFTLVEIIVTIGLIALVGTIIVTNMSGILTDRQDKQYEEFKKTLENAACVYVDINTSKKNECCPGGVCNNKTCTVKLEALLDSGLIKESDLYNPKTKITVSLSSFVQISFPSGTKTCLFQE